MPGRSAANRLLCDASTRKARSAKARHAASQGNGIRGQNTIAFRAGRFTLSVVVTAEAVAFTIAGESEQVGVASALPETPHVKLTVPVNPFCPVSVSTSVSCEPLVPVSDNLAGLRANVGDGIMFAVTV